MKLYKLMQRNNYSDNDLYNTVEDSMKQRGFLFSAFLYIIINIFYI